MTAKLIKFSLKASCFFMLLVLADYMLDLKDVQATAITEVQRSVYPMIFDNIRFEYYQIRGQKEDLILGVRNTTAHIVIENEQGTKELWRSDEEYYAGFSIYLIALLPFMVVFSLILASPISMMRKVWAAVISFFLIYFLIIIEFIAGIGHLHNTNAGLPDWGWYKLIEFQCFIYFGTSIYNTILPFLIWIFVTFRKSDLTNFLEGLSDGSTRKLFGP